MQKHFFILLIFLVAACKNSSSDVSNEVESIETNHEQTEEGMNDRVPDEEDGGEMLLGNINFSGLQEEPFQEWFDVNWEGHVLDTARTDSIRPLLKNISIKVFMGTWCEDSQREIPALYKVLNAADYHLKQLDMVAVTHDKDTPNELEKDYELEYVPTIIFFKDGAEINRIVEYPQQTLEKDILKILSGGPYQHAYAE